MYETDLPCTECGARLVERLVPPPDHPLGSPKPAQVTAAVCGDCGVRHYPEAALVALVGGPEATGGRRGDEDR